MESHLTRKKAKKNVLFSNLGVYPHAHVRVEGKVPPVVGPLPLLAISRAPLPPATLEVGQFLVVSVAQPGSMLRPPGDKWNQLQGDPSGHSRVDSRTKVQSELYSLSSQLSP